MNNKEYLRCLDQLKQVNQSIVSKEHEKGKHDTTPKRRAQLEVELKKLYKQREELKLKINEFH